MNNTGYFISPSKNFTTEQYEVYLKYANPYELETDTLSRETYNKIQFLFVKPVKRIHYTQEEYCYEDDDFRYTNDP